MDWRPHGLALGAVLLVALLAVCCVEDLGTRVLDWWQPPQAPDAPHPHRKKGRPWGFWLW